MTQQSTLIYLNHFFAQPDIKAILLKIESPGGAAGTSEAIFYELIRLKKEYPQKPVVVLTENVCASAAYNIACAADHIVASPSAVIGSIGANFRYLFQLKDFIEQYKIKYLAVKGGKFKSTTDPFVDMTPEEQAMLQNVVDDSYQLLIARIAQQRKLSPETSSLWADGRLFNGNQALNLGLIDEVGSLSNAIAKLKEKALIDRKIEWVKPPKTSTWDRLFGTSANTFDHDTVTSSLVNSICSCLEQRYGLALH